eukprot:7381260-Prymnesium_polylepis.1
MLTSCGGATCAASRSSCVVRSFCATAASRTFSRPRNSSTSSRVSPGSAASGVRCRLAMRPSARSTRSRTDASWARAASASCASCAAQSTDTSSNHQPEGGGGGGGSGLFPWASAGRDLVRSSTSASSAACSASRATCA